MCGILAVIGTRRESAELSRALDVLAHRGPDGRGEWSDPDAWLGHRRLSIIDMAGGAQPMVDPETGVVITYNGEVFNYLELRRELEVLGHRFRTHSDTEVLLRAWLAWGTDCLTRLNGMWAFVVWDPRQRRAFIARDRFGIKPCYYATIGGALIVGSEPKALIAAYPELAEVDESAIADLIAAERAHTDERSFYARIKRLPAGHWGTYSPSRPRLRQQRFWTNPEVRQSGDWDPQVAVQELDELLCDSVSIQMRSDTPVGLTLSGGIDSTAILHEMAALRAASGAGVSAYTSVYEDPSISRVDERDWARIAASKYPNVTLDHVNAPGADWLSVLSKIVWHMDGPGFSPAVFPMWMIMARARAEGVPVLLEGQGADEQYGGYGQYAAPALLDRISDVRRRPGRKTLDAVVAALRFGLNMRSGPTLLRDVVAALVGPRVANRRHRLTPGVQVLKRPPSRDWIGLPAGVGLPGPGRLEARLAGDFAVNLLPAFLQYGDRISMAHSVETRVPFLDHRLVSYASSLPPEARVWMGESKHVLRLLLRSVGQTQIGDRHDKRGYPTPAWQWMAADGGSVLREHLLDRDAQIGAVINRQELARLIDGHSAGELGEGDLIYRLLTTELWWRDAGDVPLALAQSGRQP